MKETVLKYRISEIPDPFYPQYQMAAGGDVLDAACRDFEHLLRSLVNFPPGSASMAIRYIFTPKPSSQGMQSRLSIYVMARAHDPSMSESLRLLLERGPLSRFYHLEPVMRIEAPWEKLQATCDIIRREDAVSPLHSSEYNYKIPAYYYAIRLFEPDERNNYMDLDRVLGDIMETVLIDICVQPADISAELMEHARYLSRLQSINRLWDDDEDYESDFRDYLGNDSKWRSTRRQRIKPLRYRDPFADDILRSQQRFHETLLQPHQMFHIKVFAETQAVALLLGSVVAESAYEKGSYRLIGCSKDGRLYSETLDSVNKVKVSTLPGNESFFPEKALSLYSGLSRLCHASTVDELLGVFRLPVASSISPCCIRKNTDPPIESEPNLIVFGFDKEVSNASRGIPLHQLCKHTFVSGITGSGKTTSMLNLTLQLHHYDIPFLVIEPVKTEYRILKTLRNNSDKNAHSLSETLEIYSPGDESISPFRFNPLELQHTISEDEHIENVLSCIKAAIPVEGSLPALIGEALEKVYEDHPERENPPILAELVAAAERVLAEKGYSSDTNSDFRAALEARLGVLIRRSVGKVFQCRNSVPQIEQLMKVPAIIEFDRLHTEQTCLLTLFLLTNIREYLKTVPKSAKDPRYVIIIEEAHNIVGQTGRAMASPDVADPKSFAAEYVVRMLAELRALGVGIVIVDQLTSAVAPEVIKSTSSKIAFRQVAKEDREELGASMLFGQTEIEEIARLKTGEAFFISERYHGPRRIETENLHNRFDLNTPVFNRNIIPYLINDGWYQEVFTDRTIADLAMLKEKMDLFDDEMSRIRLKIASLLAQRPQIIAKLSSGEKARAMGSIWNEAKKLERLLLDTFNSFLKKFYRKYVNSKVESEVQDSIALEMRENLIDRFESVIKPHVEQSLGILKSFIRDCRRSFN